jgi:hypothetical protein
MKKAICSLIVGVFLLYLFLGDVLKECLEKHLDITIGVILLLIISTYILYKRREGFTNEEACTSLEKSHNIVLQNMEAIAKDAVKSRDQINNGINYHNMESRDILLGDEKVSWCSRLNETSKKSITDAIAKELGEKSGVYEGADFMDMVEKQSRDQGIVYAGTDKVESEYALV